MNSGSQPDSFHKHECACACSRRHSHVSIRVTQIIIGLMFVMNSFFIRWFMQDSRSIADLSAMIGSLTLGFPIIWTAFKDLRDGSLNTNALVALAVMTLFASQHYQECGVVAFFMLLGQIIEKRTAEGALASIEALIKLTPNKARRINQGQEEEIAMTELVVGDVIRVRPGDNVAADGIIVSGEGLINQANITGESLPVEKKTMTRCLLAR